MKTIAIFGYGYVAQFLVRKLYQTHNVIIVTRKPESINGVQTIAFGQPLPFVDGVISTVPPVDGIDPVLDQYQFDCWVAYCTSTGVYGDHQGDWVSEDTLCRPTNQRGQWRLEIEQQWMAYPNSCILRLAGIYGPDRSAINQILNSAERIDKPGHLFSRIHVEDIAGFAMFAFYHNLKGIYNLADCLPASSREVIEYACDLLSKPYPKLVPFDQAVLSPMAAEFYKDSKKVNANKIRHSGYTLRFPDYKVGLENIKMIK